MAAANPELPRPDDDALALSAALVDRIAGAIEAAGGALPFHDYMRRVLYEPGLGYYSAGSHKFGAAGDFITAPEVSPWFGRCLAREAAPVLRALDGGDVLEPGAGSGRMAVAVLAELERLDALPEHYRILEVSADLRERQREILTAECPHLLERVVWEEALPEGLRGVVLANEVLDALPVHRFRKTESGPRELAVAATPEGGFVEVEQPLDDPRLRAGLATIEEAVGSLPPGYESEIGLAAEDWTTALAGSLEAGLILLIDYGFPRHEFYHPQRDGGTLMGHYRHHSHTDPFLYPGLSDLTAHVDFTAIATAAWEAGLEVAGFATQAHYLLATGLAEAMEDVNPVDQRAQAELARAMRTLTMPEEMGELFKVLALTRGDALPSLQGFALRDMRGRL
ncbi:MAG: class I SAM-dependent methyltransferase [Pseudomonadota bacterium]